LAPPLVEGRSGPRCWPCAHIVHVCRAPRRACAPRPGPHRGSMAASVHLGFCGHRGEAGSHPPPDANRRNHSDCHRASSLRDIPLCREQGRARNVSRARVAWKRPADAVGMGTENLCDLERPITDRCQRARVSQDCDAWFGLWPPALVANRAFGGTADQFRILREGSRGVTSRRSLPPPPALPHLRGRHVDV